MKKSAFLFLILLFTTGVYAQGTLNETEKLATLCKVWGFLKYYHPQVAKGKFDWDKQLIEKIPLIEKATSKDEVNKIYLEWISNLGKVKKCRKCNNNVPDSLKYNLNIGWIDDTTLFSNELITKLNFIKENRSRHQYYIKAGYMPSPSFENEKPYRDSIYPAEGCRLLCLFRYWNVINYFFPYKYAIGSDWNSGLEQMIPEFRNPYDTIAYHLAILKMVAGVNDSHAFFYSKYTNKYFGMNWVPFSFKIIDEKAIVTGFYNDTLANLDDVRYGDVILKVNNKNIAKIIAERSKYISASNEPTRLRNFTYGLFNGSTDSVQITYERDNVIKTKTIGRYPFKKFNYSWPKDTVPVCKSITDSIGYVNMGVLVRKQVDSVMELMMNKKAIIFDVRNYPNGTMYKIAEYLNKDSRPFAKFTKPDVKYPGVFKWRPEYYCGKQNNTNYYKGKIIVLFDETTQSHAEFTCMALQTAPDVTCIGSQTAGADGNVTTIPLPGGFGTWMTGLGVYYPDGRETQRIGIVPDIEVKPTIEGIKNKKDEVLNRAIEFIKTGK